MPQGFCWSFWKAPQRARGETRKEVEKSRINASFMAAFSLLRAKQVPAGRERPQKEKSWRYRNQTPGSTYLSLHSHPGIPRDWICFQTSDQSGKPLVLYLCGLKLPGFSKSCSNTLGGPGSLEGLPCFAVTNSLCLCHQSVLCSLAFLLSQELGLLRAPRVTGLLSQSISLQ